MQSSEKRLILNRNTSDIKKLVTEQNPNAFETFQVKTGKNRSTPA